MRRALAATSLVAFLVLAVLVEHGTFATLDQHAVVHWMPWLRLRPHPAVTIAALAEPETRWTLGGTLVALWTYPACVVVSGLVVGGIAWRLRDLRLAVLWVAANAVELIGKGIVHRPLLEAHGASLSGFAHSLPSGHTMRALVLATAVASLGSRGRLAYAWAVSVPFALVLIGDHTPTDVVAGALAFVALALGREC